MNAASRLAPPCLRDRRDLESEFCQDRDGDAADASGGSRDQDRAHVRDLAIDQHAMHGECRRETVGSVDHRRALIEPVWRRNQPVAGHAEIVGVTAVVIEGDAPAGADDRIAWPEATVAGLLDDARGIDSTGDGECLDDLALAGAGQSILIVDAGVADTNQNFAVGGLRDLNGPNTVLIALVVVVDTKGVLCRHSLESHLFAIGPSFNHDWDLPMRRRHSRGPVL